MGGAKNLPELTRPQLIWDYTDADAVVVLDGMSVEAVLPVWEEAAGSQGRGERKATQALRALERLPRGEPRWLRELLERALTAGHWERVHPHPLFDAGHRVLPASRRPWPERWLGPT